MSLRAVFLLLIFANLAFLGWAELIDAPPQPPPSDSISQLPQLKLLSEVRGKAAAASPSAAAASASSGAASSSSAATSAGGTPVPAAPGGATGSGTGSAGTGATPGAGRGLGIGAAPGAGAAPGTGAAARTISYGPARDPGQAPVSASDSATQVHSRRCVAIGPFADARSAGEASDLLQERGFSPRLRAAQSPPRGYWVFIGGLKSAADEARVVERLKRNGVTDAKAMPGSDGAHRVSVGLFSARDGAERRASVVRRLGFDAQIEPRPSPVEQWVDVNLDSSTQTLPAEGLLSLEESASRLEIRECPTAASPSPAGASPPAHGAANGTAGSKPLPSHPDTPAKRPDFNPQIPKPLTAAGRPRPG